MKQATSPSICDDMPSHNYLVSGSPVFSAQHKEFPSNQVVNIFITYCKKVKHAMVCSCAGSV